MLMVRHTAIKHYLIVEPYTFKQVQNFKYLKVNTNHENDMHNEVKFRINSTNGANFSLNTFLSSRVLSRTTKKTIFLAYLHIIMTYACET